MALPLLYNHVSEHIKECLKDVIAVCFTADIWILEACLMTLLSLTGWKHVLLWKAQYCKQAKSFHGSHTAEAIVATFKGTLKEWNIPKKKNCEAMARI